MCFVLLWKSPCHTCLYNLLTYNNHVWDIFGGKIGKLNRNTRILLCYRKIKKSHLLCVAILKEDKRFPLKIDVSCSIAKEGVTSLWGTISHIQSWSDRLIIINEVWALLYRTVQVLYPQSCTSLLLRSFRYRQLTPTLHRRLSAPASNSTLDASEAQAGIQRKIFVKDKKRGRKNSPSHLSVLSAQKIL